MAFAPEASELGPAYLFRQERANCLALLRNVEHAVEMPTVALDDRSLCRSWPWSTRWNLCVYEAAEAERNEVDISK